MNYLLSLPMLSKKLSIGGRVLIYQSLLLMGVFKIIWRTGWMETLSVRKKEYSKTIYRGILNHPSLAQAAKLKYSLVDIVDQNKNGCLLRPFLINSPIPSL